MAGGSPDRQREGRGRAMVGDGFTCGQEAWHWINEETGRRLMAHNSLAAADLNSF